MLFCCLLLHFVAVTVICLRYRLCKPIFFSYFSSVTIWPKWVYVRERNLFECVCVCVWVLREEHTIDDTSKAKKSQTFSRNETKKNSCTVHSLTTINNISTTCTVLHMHIIFLLAWVVECVMQFVFTQNKSIANQFSARGKKRWIVFGQTKIQQQSRNKNESREQTSTKGGIQLGPSGISHRFTKQWLWPCVCLTKRFTWIVATRNHKTIQIRNEDKFDNRGSGKMWKIST